MWTLDADSKLIVSWLEVGEVHADLAGPPTAYNSPVRHYLNRRSRMRSAQSTTQDAPEGQRRYSPAVWTGATRMRADPDEVHMAPATSSARTDDADVDAALHAAGVLEETGKSITSHSTPCGTTSSRIHRSLRVTPANSPTSSGSLLDEAAPKPVSPARRVRARNIRTELKRLRFES